MSVGEGMRARVVADVWALGGLSNGVALLSSRMRCFEGIALQLPSSSLLLACVGLGGRGVRK
eukprot:2066034-Alexandrium_andersonii.AAC.1